MKAIKSGRKCIVAHFVRNQIIYFVFVRNFKEKGVY